MCIRDRPESLAILEDWKEKQPEKFRLLKLDVPFNYSLLNNQAVEKSRGKYLLFLNNDTEIISPEWIGAMVEQAQRKSIGACLLYTSIKMLL